MAGSMSQGVRIEEHRIDIGAQVGIQRNSAFASGGRIKRMTPIAYVAWRPLLSAKDGLTQLTVGTPNAA
jgi:hypothetical protein